jgi:vitamin B12 transporter
MKKIFFVAAALFISIVAQAQDSTKTLNEVVVSANKFPSKTSLTGKVVTVITKEQLQTSGGKDLAQVLTEQTGIFINGANSNAGKDKGIYLRGAKVDHTLITIDGVPVYDPSGIGSNFDIRLISVDQIERVEILKGSQSTLYGSDAMAGVINIITKQASNKKASFNGGISYGSFYSYRADANVSGSSKYVDYSIGGAYFETEGINEATDSIKNNSIKKDKDDYTQQNFSASIGIKPNKNIRFQPYIRYAKFWQSYDQGAFTDELDLFSKNKNVQVGVKNEINFGRIKMNLLYNFNKNERTYIDDSTKSRNGYDIYSKGIYNGSEHFAEAFFIIPIKANMKLTAGADYRQSNSDQFYSSIGYFGPYESNLGKDSLKQNQLSGYVAFLLNTKKGFNVELGGRYNRHSVYGSNIVYNANPSLLINNKFKIFGNLSSAYKTPTLYQLLSEYGNKKLKPENAMTIETGFQYFSKNNKYSGGITVYKRMVKDAIVFFYDPITFASFYINQDKQNDAGIEIESTGKIGKSTNIKINGAYVDGKVTTKNGDKDTSYFNLIRRPKATMGLHISQQIKSRFYVNAGISYVGERTDLSYDANFNPISIKLKDYCLVNLYTEYALSKNKVKFFLDIRNLTNTNYTEVYGFNAMKTNASLGVRFNY